MWSSLCHDRAEWTSTRIGSESKSWLTRTWVWWQKWKYLGIFVDAASSSGGGVLCRWQVRVSQVVDWRKRGESLSSEDCTAVILLPCLHVASDAEVTDCHASFHCVYCPSVRAWKKLKKLSIVLYLRWYKIVTWWYWRQNKINHFQFSVSPVTSQAPPAVWRTLLGPTQWRIHRGGGDPS